MLKLTVSRRRQRVSLVTTGLILAGSALLTGCSKPPEIQKIEGYAQGTTYHVSWWSDKAVANDEVQRDFNTTLAQIDEELSTYRDDSYISHFNHSSSTDWQPASVDFIELVNIAKDISQKTQGCYDPTIGPLFDLWGFKKDVLNVPAAEQIAAVKAEMGMDKIEVDEAGKRVRKTLPQLQVNFSSMGEGYTIGKLSAVLESKGVSNYLVEFGGDMKIRGHKPDGKKWRVAIERPVPGEGGRTVHRIVTIDDESGVTLDTSGTYRHHFDAAGKMYSHILDPRSGTPVTHDLVSASVFGTDPRVSDAWATAMLCMGQEEGMQVAKRENLQVFFIQLKQSNLIDSKSDALAASKGLTFEQP
ncbi:FAD:protein FMN transferase [Pokkaliibacter sp. MBI-7]|uniref:FAD:protein FMN transferase n=1 Tax=Pokkaliibacter sp. MBI-7 TaxID=3040600 RepID=UPI00244BB04F|nr:FAD:protein FMN transferase [Pokkaliibacter sp. MBI-7]MDH2436414.1 FAD:protein FMN transferase [Pokkaliibacter sp. MBI-7]